MRSKIFYLRAFLIILVALAILYLSAGAYLASELTRPRRRVSQLGALATLPREESDRALLWVHGFNTCRSCEFDGRFIEFANTLHASGFNILMIDLRGHGESEGERVTFGKQEKWDVLGAVDWLHQRGFTKIGVLGASLGAVSTVEAALEPNGGQVTHALRSILPAYEEPVVARKHLRVLTNLLG
jgi:pimeloyl-ACP methyl ester carboxylesterase